MEFDAYVYVPGMTSLITQVKDGKCIYLQTPIAEIMQQHPTAIVTSDWEEIYPMIEAATREKFCRPPVEIDEETWYDALECLPPARWVHKGETESFVMPEAWSLNIYSIYVRIGDKHYRLQDTPKQHDELVAMCKAA